jgi:hypothetical protein
VLRQAGGGKAGLQRSGDDARRVAALRAAAQDHRVAGFQAQGAGVGADVGSRLVDHPDHPDRRGDARNAQAVGALRLVQYAAHGIRQPGDSLNRRGHRFYAVRVEAQPVDECRIATALPGIGHIERVGLDQLLAALAQRTGRRSQSLVLAFRVGAGKHAGGKLPLLAKPVDEARGVLRRLGNDFFGDAGHV